MNAYFKSVAFLLALSLLFFIYTYVGSIDDFTLFDAAAIGLLTVLVVAVEALLVSVMPKKWLRGALVAAFGVFNIYAVNISMNEFFVFAGVPLQFAFLTVGLFIVFALYDFYSGLKLNGIWVALCVLIAGSAVIVTSPLITKAGSYDSRTASDKFEHVKFKTSPNVYILSYDSMVPEPIFKKLFNQPASPYHAILQAKFARYTNLFSDGLGTVNSLNSFLAYTPNVFLDVSEGPKAILAGRYPSPLLTGLYPSPFFQIFKANGYEVTTHMGWDSWGPAGIHVDNYKPKRPVSKACLFFGNREVKVVFFGFCRFSKRANRYVSVYEHAHRVIEETMGRNAPQLVFGHIYSPGHTPASYNAKTANEDGQYDEFVEWYVSRSKDAAKSIETMADMLAKHDPQAVFFIFGDHGPATTRGLQFEDDPKKIFPDFFGVYGGFLASGSCATMPAETSRRYSTLQMVGHDIVRCLSGADRDVPERLSPFGWEGRRYDEFLYD